MTTKPRALSLFTGMGGLDLGLEAAGFRIVAGLERDAACLRNLRANTNWRILGADIHDVESEELLRAARCRAGEVDLLAGGPPCQPFSKSGYWHKGRSLRLDDPRASTLEAFLRVLRDVVPRVFLLENVEGLIYRGKDEGLLLLRRVVENINAQTGHSYSLSVLRLNAADYGVPQLRTRVFVIGERDGHALPSPPPTHVEPDKATILGLKEHSTAWSAIGDIREPEAEELSPRGKWADLLQTIPEGKNYLWHTDRGGGQPLFGWRRRYWSFLLKLAKNRPSWTIQAAPGPATGPFHWNNRRLSARELCRLQSIPDSYQLEGSLMEKQRLAGSAVPSLLAEVLGRSIRREFFGSRIDPSATKLQPPPAQVPPPPEKLPRTIPKRFAAQVGEHEAHPGTGLGPGAASSEG